MNYTEEVTEQITAEYAANPCKETVLAISERIGKSTRSVIAKLSSAGVYKKPERTNKLGEPIELKEELAMEICTALGIEVPSLVKAQRQELKLLRDAIRDLIEGIEDE